MSRRAFEPREYQPMGIDHIKDHRRCALWAGMGLGKGVMTLTALSELEVTEDVFPALALGPKRVARDVWPTECDKWEHLSHLACVPVIGDPDERRRALRYDSPIYSINYENLPWLVEHYGDAWPFTTVIADESTKLKSYRGSYRKHPKTGKVFLHGAGGSRAKALGTVAHERVSRFIELTGTPSPNGLIDLWGQMWFLDKGERLGRTFEGFKQRWFRSGYDGFSLEPLPNAEAEIAEAVRDLCLTIDAKDYFDLHGPVVNDIYVDLPPQAMKLYRDMEKNMFAEMENATVEAFGAAARTQKCLQLANGAVYIDQATTGESDSRAKQWRAVHDVKMEALDSIVEEAGGAPMMVVYTFRSDLARIMKAYPGKSVDLTTTAGLKQFKAGKAELGVCHADSVGHGVDGLQEVCAEITHFGHGWSLDTYDQINERIGEVRQQQSGFSRVPTINHIFARGTLDEDVHERRKTKRSVQDTLKEAAKRRKV